MKPVPVSWLMGMVAIVALGLAAMRVGSLLATSLVMGMMLMTLAVGTLAAIVRPAPAASCRGFALFAWIYVGSTFVRPDHGWGEDAPLPYGLPIHLAADRMHRVPSPPPMPTDPVVLAIQFDPDGQPTFARRGQSFAQTSDKLEEARRYHDARRAHIDAVMARGRAVEYAVRIGHASLALAFGLIGAIAGLLIARRPGRADVHATRPSGAGDGREITEPSPPQLATGTAP